MAIIDNTKEKSMSILSKFLGKWSRIQLLTTAINNQATQTRKVITLME